MSSINLNNVHLYKTPFTFFNEEMRKQTPKLTWRAMQKEWKLNYEPYPEKVRPYEIQLQNSRSQLTTFRFEYEGVTYVDNLIDVGRNPFCILQMLAAKLKLIDKNDIRDIDDEYVDSDLESVEFVQTKERLYIISLLNKNLDKFESKDFLFS